MILPKGLALEAIELAKVSGITATEAMDLLARAAAFALLPDESVALSIALDQLREDEPIAPPLAAACVLALARITGRLNDTAKEYEQ